MHQAQFIDAVMVATPDHTHAIIAADTMTLGKHVYVQKPLSHSVYESRLLTFNEMVMMGVLAVRLQSLNKILEWDKNNMRFSNINDNEEIRLMISEGFVIKEGHPSFNAKMSDPINAKQFAKELIKHNYREGWKLPAIP